ncbi:hypothetical protein [Cohnella cholangitidis]|uniref:Uncharacterized protein n=1 Tax=Cohnella cholangitidis TaxID=2598458 RepID=A0A7G5BSZ1_9BACL|nr:hypothetical protein [Cohnella cholangitidis]QMV40075.1 hypothetical protein FPL14_01820 [Cohnella cholangitidis]
MQSLVELYNYIKANPVLTLSASLVGYLIVWIYKESRTEYISNIRESIEEKTIFLLLYGRIESAILLFLKNKCPDTELKLYESFGESAHLLSNQIRHIFIDTTNDDNTKFPLILTLVQAEIYKLRNQLDEAMQENKMDSVEKFITSLIAPMKPISYLIFFCLIAFISFISFNQSTTWFDRMNIICFSISFTFGIMVFAIFSKEFINNKIKKRSRYFMFCIITISIAPFISLIFVDISLISIVIQASMIYLVDKRGKNNRSIEAVQVGNNFR